MSSGAAASAMAVLGSIRTTARPRSRASSPIAGATAMPSSASSSRMPAARLQLAPPWEGGQALKPGDDPWQTIAPSAIPFGADWPTPRAMTLADIERVREAFVAAARRAVRIGFDAIELHMAHGYLLHSFVSPISNKRTDDYGGADAARMRFPLEVAQAVREVMPKGMPLGARMTGSDWVEGGLTPDDAVDFAKALKAVGPRLSSASPRAASRAETRPTMVANMNVQFAEKVKRGGRHRHPRRRADRHAQAGRSDRGRGQGRHGGAGARLSRRSALGLARGAMRSAPMSRARSNTSAPRPRCGRGPPSGIDRSVPSAVSQRASLRNCETFAVCPLSGPPIKSLGDPARSPPCFRAVRTGRLTTTRSRHRTRFAARWRAERGAGPCCASTS